MGLTIEGKTRKDILDIALSMGNGGAHIAPSLSLVEIGTAICRKYEHGKDVFILSKGHAALGYYSVLHQNNVITDDQFYTYGNDGGEYPGHPSRTGTNKVDCSTGSLGMGITYGVGRALADKNCNVYVIVGDGECNEGTVWEAAALAARHKLANLKVFVDMNGLQSDGWCKDVLDMNIPEIWKAFGWEAEVCDGHDTDALAAAMEKNTEKPVAIIAKTVKGKGVSFIENNNEWHRHELSREQYDQAMEEIGEKYGLD